MIRPRPYLSWSQLSTLESSERQYIKTYIYDQPMRENEGMAFGKEVAESLETGEATGNLQTDIQLLDFPKLDVMEYKIEHNIRVGQDIVPILSRIDTAREDLTAFYEYKTGSTSWNQAKADAHGQITFYATAIYELTGKIPEEMKLIWAPTERNAENKIVFTGEILHFKTTRTVADIIKMKIRMKKAWDRIGWLTEKAYV